MDSQTYRTNLSRRDVMLGLSPGFVYLLEEAGWYLWSPDSWMLTWGITALTAAVLMVYIVTAIRARRITDGLIMGSGVLVVLLTSVATTMVSHLIPAPSGHVSILSVRKVSAALASMSVMVIPTLLVVWGGILSQRGHGAISLLPIASFLLLIQQDIIDPTYAWLIWLPESTAPLAAFVIVMVLAPLVIGMPLLTARADAPRRGYIALLGMGLLAGELSTFAGLIRVIAMQGQVSNAPGMGDTILRMLTINQAFVILPVLLLAGIAAIYLWLEHRPPPAHPAPVTAAP